MQVRASQEAVELGLPTAAWYPSEVPVPDEVTELGDPLAMRHGRVREVSEEPLDGGPATQDVVEGVLDHVGVDGAREVGQGPSGGRDGDGASQGSLPPAQGLRPVDDDPARCRPPAPRDRHLQGAVRYLERIRDLLDDGGRAVAAGARLALYSGEG